MAQRWKVVTLVSLVLVLSLLACSRTSRLVQPPTETMDEFLRLYQVVGKTILDLPDHPATAVHFVSKTGLIGAVAEIDRDPVIIREPSPTAGGLVGPDSAPKLWSADLDNDGILEIVLEGLNSPHTWGVWVYHFDRSTNSFQHLADLAGDAGIDVVRSSSEPTRFEVTSRDWTKPAGSSLARSYVWSKDKFQGSAAITRTEALDKVRQRSEVIQYITALQQAGLKLFISAEETPSRFIVRVGEESPAKVTIVSYYLVAKQDGSVKQWKIADGELPTD